MCITKHEYEGGGVPYCECLLVAKHGLEQQLERVERYETRLRKLLDLIGTLPTADEDPGPIELPMTESDVRRAMSRRWQHSDGSPLTAEEEVERDRELFAALTDLRYRGAIHAEMEDLNAGVKRARHRLDTWRRYFNQAVRIQAKHEADARAAREANRASRRSRGRRRKNA
jgi:hypothetical protein